MKRRELLLKEFKNDDRFIFNSEKEEWEYIGLLTLGKMPACVKAGYSIWAAQGNRCENSNDINFHYYGAKGVKRLWTSRECINWYINQFLTRSSWIKPDVVT
jgi:hypothetical protein